MQLISPAPEASTLAGAVERARRDEAEAAHALRVSTRRLDAWLALAGLHTLRDDLRWLRRAAGPIRDLDVVLQRAESRGHVRHAQERRPEEHAALVVALDEARTSALLGAIARMPAVDVGDARTRLPRLVRPTLREPSASDAEGLHALRRAVRRLRYALEWLREDPGPLPAVQEVFGRLSDGLVTAKWAQIAGPLDADVAEDAVASWREARPFLVRLAS
jgi:CHAD domain-containing protein